MFMVMPMRVGLRGFTMMHLQFIVFGKTHDKVPRHHVEVAQIMMHDHAAHIVHTGRDAPWGIGEMFTLGLTAWAELTHHAGQTLSPITGAKCAAR